VVGQGEGGFGEGLANLAVGAGAGGVSEGGKAHDELHFIIELIIDQWR